MLWRIITNVAVLGRVHAVAPVVARLLLVNLVAQLTTTMAKILILISKAIVILVMQNPKKKLAALCCHSLPRQIQMHVMQTALVRCSFFFPFVLLIDTVHLFCLILVCLILLVLCTVGWSKKGIEKNTKEYNCAADEIEKAIESSKEYDAAIKKMQDEMCTSTEKYCGHAEDIKGEPSAYVEAFEGGCHDCDGAPETCEDGLKMITGTGCYRQCAIGWTAKKLTEEMEQVGCSEEDIEEMEAEISAEQDQMAREQLSSAIVSRGSFATLFFVVGSAVVVNLQGFC